MARDEQSEGVVPLSRWRALLARSRNPRKRLELLLADPQAGALVPRIPVEDFYYLVRGVGLEDAIEAIRLASPEQLQACLDIDLWERDRLSTPRLLVWLEMLAELPPRSLVALLRTIDAELVSLIVGRHTRIHDPSAGEAPADDSRHVVYPTPDGTYVVELVTSNATAARILERFLDRIYRADPDFACALLTEAKWGTIAELEDESYRWRTARLGDMGFPPYDEAMAVYRLVDPARAMAPAAASAAPAAEPSMLPAPFADSLGEDSFIGRVLAEIDDPALMVSLSAAIVGLLNRVLVADRIDPSDLEAVRDVSARARDTLSLGLEHLAGGDVGRAKAVAERTAVLDVFRVGFSLTAALGRRAQALDRAGVFDPNLDALIEPRPRFPCELGAEPTAGLRPFRSLADLRAVEAYLAELESRESPG